MLRLVGGFTYREVERATPSTDLWGRPNPAWKNGEPAVMRGTLEFDFDERDTEQLTELFKVFGLNFPPST